MGISQELCHFTHPREKSFVQHPQQSVQTSLLCVWCHMARRRSHCLPNGNTSTWVRLVIQMNVFYYKILPCFILIAQGHPPKRTSKLALCVVSHATQTLPLLPKDNTSTWARLILPLFISIKIAQSTRQNGQTSLLCAWCHMPHRRSHCLPVITNPHGHV